MLKSFDSGRLSTSPIRIGFLSGVIRFARVAWPRAQYNIFPIKKHRGHYA